MGIDKATVARMAKLSRLEFSEAEQEKLAPQIDEIVSFVEKINELDTENVQPTYHVVDIKNIRRADENKASLSVSMINELAPDAEYDHIVVPQVID